MGDSEARIGSYGVQVIAAVAAYALVLLQGFVTIGPTSPQCYGRPSCTKPDANQLLMFTRQGHFAHAVTDKHGHYSVWLSPGTWTVLAAKTVGTRPAKIIVPSVATMKRNFSVETGIR